MSSLILPWWRIPLRWWPTYVQWAGKRFQREIQSRATLGALMRRLRYCTTGVKITRATKLRINKRYGKAR